MEAREPISLNAVNTDGLGLQVQFFWHQDRHCHTISLLVDDRRIPVFESVEGSNVEDWPPSPALQQLSVEELRPDTLVGLLVGMAGKSHYSISIEPTSGRAAFVFDVACRSSEPPEQLGSGYLLVAHGLTPDGDHDAIISVEGRTMVIRCDRDGETTAKIKDDQLGTRIEPAMINSGGTTRWRYTIELG
ncbi:MAG: hypothetical protein H8E66_12150 [Planctomycetes bacterium]|nr:hypothetical protein [Planctomycetota bacterium]